MSEFSRLSEESFVTTKVKEYEDDSSAHTYRIRSFSADLPDKGLQVLYPLRVSYSGSIKPHVYAERMRRQERKGGNGGLSAVHRELLSLTKFDYLYHTETADFEFLIGTTKKSPYKQHPELSEKLEDAFGEFQNLREQHRIAVAKRLTGTIKRADLYMVCEDPSDAQTGGTETFYTARLSEIIHQRSGRTMNYNVVAKDFDGNEGLLPPKLYVFAGACAIAS